MEAINKMTAAAANVVWGTGSDKTTDTKTAPGAKVEPLSGVTGDTAKGEPYDAGNITPAPTSADITFPASPMEDEKPIEAGPEAIVSPEETDVPPKDISTPTAQLQKLQLQHEEPSPCNEEPQPQLQHEESEPQPIEPASKEGGTEGESKAGSDTTLSQPASKVAGSAEQKSAPESAPEEPGTEESSTKTQGTGEEYVQSTGLQADGGDFDATKPGAGFEADRLLEEKGGREGSQDGSDSGHKGKAKTHASKRSLGERIKAKLHKDKH